MKSRLFLLLVLAASLLAPATVRAQTAHSAPSLVVTGGYTGFVDESLINHSVLGGGAEWIVTPRIAVGPELLYMVGPGDDRDLFVVGTARFGFRPFTRRTVPFATVGGGWMIHSYRFGPTIFRNTEGAFLYGGGVRIAASPRVYVAPEFTMGWEPHVRLSVNVGIALR